MEIPDELLCLFSARIESQDGSHVIEVPESEFDLGGLDAGSTYRVAVLPAAGESDRSPRPAAEGRGGRSEHRDPPVEVGDVREVEIEDIHTNFAIASVVENHDA